MEFPEDRTVVGAPGRRKYRLNKRKFAAAMIALVCVLAMAAVAVISLLGAVEANAVALNTGIGLKTQSAAQSTPAKTQKTGGTGAVGLKGRKIVVDAGHGGFDPGAIGANGSHEAELNLAIAKYLKAELESRGVEVIMTREEDVGLGETQTESLQERRRIIVESGSDIVISVHINSDNSNVSGPLALFMSGSENGKRLAESVQKSLNDALDAKGNARSEGNLYILKSGNQPCVLVECGFISNKDEERLLGKQDYQKKVAKAVCNGAEAYFS